MADNALQQAAILARKGFWIELKDQVLSCPELASKQDEFGNTLLSICANYPGSADIIKTLIAQFGADPNHRSMDGSSVLSKAIVGGSKFGLSTIPEMLVLLELGANPNLIADCGMPALHWAISQNRLEHAKILLEKGADINALTSDDPPETVVDIANRMRFYEAIEFLKNSSKECSKRAGSDQNVLGN